MACSLICATKKLSTMLYSEFTSMEKTIGSAMDASSGPTGFSFINVLFMKIPLYIRIVRISGAENRACFLCIIKATQSVFSNRTDCVAKKVQN